VFSIYHTEGQSLLSIYYEELKWLLNRRIEIGAHAILIGRVIVVRIAVVVHISKISRRHVIRYCPLKFVAIFILFFN